MKKIALIIFIAFTIAFALLLSVTCKDLVTTKQQLALTCNELQASVVKEAFSDAEYKLTVFASHPLVVEALKDRTKLPQAQSYCEQVSQSLPNLEGLYISDWNTEVIVHSDTTKVGLTTRTDEKLVELQEKLLHLPDNLYNAGIITSPATGEKILSIYRAIFDDSDRPIGLVGIGLYTDSLTEQLVSKTTANHACYLVDTKEKTILFSTSGDYSYNFPDRVLNQKALRTKDFIYTTSSYDKYDWAVITALPASVATRSLRIQITLFVSVYIVLIILIIISLKFTNKLNETREELEESLHYGKNRERDVKTLSHIDLGTGARNRVTFLSDFKGYQLDKDQVQFFMMINVNNLADLNGVNGLKKTDEFLQTLVTEIRNSLLSGEVYRTGSSEFIYTDTIHNSTADINNLNSLCDHFMYEFCNKYNNTGGLIPELYVATGTKTGKLSYSVMVQLKVLMKNNLNYNNRMLYFNLDA